MLFRKENFISAAGIELDWKIECDALTQEDWDCIAHVSISKLPPFNLVIGVPRGGLALAKALAPYADETAKYPMIVDDVWTTGTSMVNFATERFPIWRGFVAFNRGILRPGVNAFMTVI